jgi:hypothetical protein
VSTTDSYNHEHKISGKICPVRITISMRTGMTKVMGTFQNFGKARKKTGTGNTVRKIKMSGDCGGQYQAKSTFTIILTWK